jgi:hypothetical protein
MTPPFNTVMKPRHAAALALWVFWHLLIPPVDMQNKPDAAMPLKYWTNLEAFRSAEECEKKMALDRQTFSSAPEASPEHRRIAAIQDAQCVSSDDPRLQPN